jgi:hypothetical protein
VLGEARCTDAEAVSALHARTLESTSTLHAAPADQLDEVLMIEQWFRARPSELGRTAPTMVEALQHLVTDSEATDSAVVSDVDEPMQDADASANVRAATDTAVRGESVN